MPVTTLTEALVLDLAAGAGLDNLSFVLERLDRPGHARIEIEPGRYLYPASMLKTPLALAAYTLVHERELQLDQTFEVVHENMTVNDLESPLVPGYTATLCELVELMITRSDNVATNVLYDVLGRERATRIAQDRYGLRATAFWRKLSGSMPLINDPEWDGVHRNAHSAGDAARLFELIARDEVPFALKLRQTLARQQWKNKLPGGLDPGDQFAHKTGDTDEVTHDGGILDTADGASYAIVVYTGMESNDANNAKFAPFMRSLREYL